MQTEIVYYDVSIPKFLLSKILKPIWKDVVFSGIGLIVYKNNYEFSIQDPKEVLTKTLRGGICGSDLHLILLDFDLNVLPAIIPSPNPRYMGHECVGEIIEVGDSVSKLQKGQKFVVQKGACCLMHSADNLCKHCVDGNFWLCINAGKFIEFSHYDAAGGWGSGFVYHEEQLLPIPDSITTDQAVLIEPLACSLRGVLRAGSSNKNQILIIGAGTIGLCTLAALKAVFPETNVTIIARHDFQAEQAKKLGADDVFQSKDIFTLVKEKTNAIEYKGIFGNKALIGGFDLVYDCVGNETTVHNALRWTKGGGKVMLLGIDLKQGKIDYSPIWYQEIDLTGSLIHGVESWEEESLSTFELVIKFIEEGKIPSSISDLITHRYKLHDYKKAIKTALDKKKNESIKVVFDFEI
ncbi:MAG: zinc-dependent alcohol dehydrogenase [Candidatus Heimdallarchaeaceae archaeon]